MHKVLALVFGLFLVLEDPASSAAPRTLDSIATDYVRLAMGVQRLHPDWIDMQEVPQSFKAEAEAAKLDAPAMVAMASGLIAQLDATPVPRQHLLAQRRSWLRANLVSLRMQLQAKAGSRWPVQEEVALRYGFEPKFSPLSSYDPILVRLDKQMSGSGTLTERINRLRRESIVPPDKVQAVQAAAFAECRKRAATHVRFPKGESVEVRWNDDPLFDGNNIFKGNGHSVTDLSRKSEWGLDRLLWVTCHETYPGHHLHFATMSAELFHKRGWPEFSMSLVYGPQVASAEAVAEYAMWLTFPIEDRIRFERDVLYPLAGLKMSNADDWRAYWVARSDLLGASATIARDYLDGKLNKDGARDALVRYRLMPPELAAKTVPAIDAVGSYIIASDVGWMTIDRRLRGRPQSEQWRVFQRVMEEPMTVADLERL